MCAVLLTISLVFLGILIWRNEYVYMKRSQMQVKILKRSHEAIEKGEEWRKYYIAFDDVSYNDMVLKFWRPAKFFYRGTILEDEV